jgi:hypothetical protein
MTSSQKTSAGDKTPERQSEKPKHAPTLEDQGVGTDDEGFLVLPPGFRRERKPDEKGWVFETWM